MITKVSLVYAIALGLTFGWLIAAVFSQPVGTNTSGVSTGMISTGAKPVLTGTCTTGTQIGGTFAGSFTATCTAQTVILTFPFPAPNGWVCDAHDQTTPGDAMNQTGSSTTSATLTGTTAAADVVSFKCAGF